PAVRFPDARAMRDAFEAGWRVVARPATRLRWVALLAAAMVVAIGSFAAWNRLGPRAPVYERPEGNLIAVMPFGTRGGGTSTTGDSLRQDVGRAFGEWRGVNLVPAERVGEGIIAGTA